MSYKYKATNLIAEHFEENGIKFDVSYYESGNEVLSATFGAPGGKRYNMRFISTGDNNDVVFRVYDLIENISKEKQTCIQEVCDNLNKEYRFFKFRLDESDNSIIISYDFLQNTPDNAVGPMAYEIAVRTSRMVDDDYKTFMKALYAD